MRRIVKHCLLVASQLLAMAAHASNACGSLENPYGPFDYRTERLRALVVVDGFHFNARVENLIGGQNGRLGEDLDYVLRAAPNHHRALVSIVNWAVKVKSDQPPSLPRTVDCYFDRAMRFRADDLIPRLLFVSYLQRMGRRDAAMSAIKPLLERSDLEGITHQNLGLLLTDLGDNELALKQAHLAIEKGWIRPELRDRLVARGSWREPAANPAAEPAASTPASAPASAASS